MNSGAYQIGLGLGYIALAFIFGFVTKTINENKGHEGGFAWGFWLGIIGIIVVACKPDNRSYYQANQNQDSYALRALEQEERNQRTLSEGGWKCTCGRVNQHYISTCACGKTKREIIYGMTMEENHVSNKKSESKDEKVIELIKKLSELHKNGVLTDDEFNTKKESLLAQIGQDTSFDT